MRLNDISISVYESDYNLHCYKNSSAQRKLTLTCGVMTTADIKCHGLPVGVGKVAVRVGVRGCRVHAGATVDIRPEFRVCTKPLPLRTAQNDTEPL